MITTASLQERYDALKKDHPRLRIRDAAGKLGVSELALLELNLGGDVVRLKGPWPALLREVENLGKVMALTRNDFAVHERKGVYHNVSFVHDGKVGLAVNPDIDLRLFMEQWRHGYAVRMQSGGRELHSLQFFNEAGLALHKIYLTPDSDRDAYDDLTARYTAPDQSTRTPVQQASPAAESTAHLTDFDEIEAFRQDWLDLEDTHDFFPLLKKYGLPRTQALRLAPEGHAIRLNKGAIVRLFEAAAAAELPIMVFVGSPGCIQIHTGPVRRLVTMQEWFNVMDPDFNLHLNLRGVAEAWITRKPTVDGIVTGLEVYDRAGEMIVQCFGKRKPGAPELEAWRDIAHSLIEQHQIMNHAD